MPEPPIDDWARDHALREVARVARELLDGDADRDLAPRLGELTPGQQAMLEAGLRVLEAEQP